MALSGYVAVSPISWQYCVEKIGYGIRPEICRNMRTERNRHGLYRKR
jgi:hypothetical protein